MTQPVYEISMFVLTTDHIHRGTNDNTCSRCRWTVPNDEVALKVSLSGHDLLIYCETCLRIPKPEA
jgi:hypothetical protein